MGAEPRRPGLTSGTDLLPHRGSRQPGRQPRRFRLINYPSTTPVSFGHLVAAVRTTGLDVDPAPAVVTVQGSTGVTLPAERRLSTDAVWLAVMCGEASR